MPPSLLAVSPLLFSLTYALTVPTLRARQEAGPAPSTCAPLTDNVTSVITHHPCTNDVFESKTPGYYSSYLDANELFEYDNQASNSEGSDSLGNFPIDSSYIISQNWILTCNVDNICNKIPAANESSSTVSGQWITDYTNPNCLMGFYFPNATSHSTYTQGAQIPTRDDCVHRIMGALLVEMAAGIASASTNTTSEDPIPNRGSVNIAADGFPDFLYGADSSDDPYANGAPVLPGWPMWFVQGWPDS